MKKTRNIIIGFFFAYFWVCALINPFNPWDKAQANDQLTGHIITEVVKGNQKQMMEVLEKELETLAYKYTIELTQILQKNLPNILEFIAADIRLKADEIRKCELLKGSSNGCI